MGRTFTDKHMRTIYMPDQLHERLKAAAAEDRRSLNGLAVEAIEWYLNEKELLEMGMSASEKHEALVSCKVNALSAIDYAREVGESEIAECLSETLDRVNALIEAILPEVRREAEYDREYAERAYRRMT
jgi:predicted DNA-binding protein